MKGPQVDDRVVTSSVILLLICNEICGSAWTYVKEDSADLRFGAVEKPYQRRGPFV